MKVMVTGATGYAGFAASLALRRAGHRVFGLVRSDTSEVAKRLVQHEVSLVVGTLSDPDSLGDTFAEMDAFVHTVFDRRDPVATDQKFLQQLAKSAAGSSRPKGLIYTTGCSIYGKVPERIMDETTPGNPECPLAFRMTQEQEVLAMSAIRKVVVRPGFMYGGDARSSMSGLWFQASVEAKKAGAPLRYFGSPDKHWSWVHIDDLATAYVTILDRLSSLDGEIFCLADEQRVSALEGAKASARAAGHSGEIEMRPAAEGGFFMIASDQDELITSAKARRLLGWVPQHTGYLDELPLYFAAWQAAAHGR